MNIKIALIAVISLLVGVANATNPNTQRCAALLSGIERTLGVEWEFKAVNIKVSEDMHPLLRGMLKDRAYDEALATSNFRRLFAFHGKDTSGQYVQGLIPPEVVRSEKFAELRRVEGVKFEMQQGQTFLVNWETMPPEAFIKTLRGLYEARGQYNDTLQIRKISSAWTDLNTENDRLIPDMVAEEWRNGNHFAGIEFPMDGYTNKASELRSYLQNLWIRLGLFKPAEAELQMALEQATGHVHWVADIQSLPAEHRQSAYEAIIGFWGDANDSVHVAHKNPFKDDVRSDGTVQISSANAESIYMTAIQNLEYYSITVLDQKTYDRLSATSSGILIDGRANDLDVNVDPNIPPVFKRLAFGLRGIYGQQSLPDGIAIPKVGIEAKTMPTVTENITALPKLIEGTNKVDVEQLLAHRSDRSRGISSSISELKANAERLGLDVSLVDDLLATVSKERYGWNPELVVADILLPLTDWLSHPLVQRNLNSLPVPKRAAVQIQFNRAIEQYVSRLNDLARARKEPRREYHPDWTDRLDQFPDGYNRVYSRSGYPEIGQLGGLNSRPDMWFLMILQAEVTRFIAESGLGDLLQMP